MEWTPEKDKKLLELKEQKLTYEDIAKEMNTTLNSVAKRLQKLRQKPLAERVKGVEEYKYEETHEIMADGSHKSGKLLRMDEKKKKNVKFLLEAHGYDPEEWELTKAENNIWNTNDKERGVQTLYSSKITTKPKVQKIDFDKFIEKITKLKPVKAVRYKGTLPKEETYLYLPLFDLHFGTSTLEYYQETLQKILQLLEKSYHEVLIVMGQDMLHNDNFRGQTANGTPIDKVDMVKAWNDADIFYTSIIEKALETSPKVTVVYSKGNHDESISWGFARMFEKAYKHCAHFDTRFKERKAYLLGTNFIGITHGDKNRKNVASNFSVEFPELWSMATTREVFVGHLHRKRVTKQSTELVFDDKGVIVREMGSGCDIDQYHDDNGYTLAHKEFEVYEYGESKKKRIHYV